MYMINDIFGEKWKRDVIIVYTSSPSRSTFKYTVYHIKYKGSDAYFEHIKKSWIRLAITETWTNDILTACSQMVWIKYDFVWKRYRFVKLKCVNKHFVTDAEVSVVS